MPDLFPTPDRVLIIVAHPDDAEFGSGGTIARWATSGSNIRLVVVTDGSKGSAEPDMTSEELVKIREGEERAAAAILGINEVVFLGYEDGRVENTLDLRRDIVRQIREHKPDILITHDPTARIIDNRIFNHTDHRAVGDTTLDCVYPLARDRLNFPEHEAEGLEPHKVLDVFLQGSNEWNYLVDITDTIETKIRSLWEHKSQIGEPERLAKFLRERYSDIAADSSMNYAERFRRVRLGR
jgi:LmbE family N-acetylglucosaminyl deacetylase